MFHLIGFSSNITIVRLLKPNFIQSVIIASKSTTTLEQYAVGEGDQESFVGNAWWPADGGAGRAYRQIDRFSNSMATHILFIFGLAIAQIDNYPPEVLNRNPQSRTMDRSCRRR